MKTSISLIALSFVLLFSNSALAMKIGKVDVQKVLVTVEQGKKVRDQLKKEFDSKQAEIRKEEDKIRKQQEEFEKKSAVMNDKAKGQKQKEIQDGIMALQQKSMDYQKSIQEMENNLKRPILENIKKIVEDVSKSAGVDVTFEMSTAPIIFAKDEKDLTEDVIKAYNKKYK
ncbi:MAG: OmpH family outer membrane protein [Bdellovibrio sp.]